MRVGDGILDYGRLEGGAEVLWIWRIGCCRSRDNGQAHRVTITRSHDTRPVTRLAILLITALREMSAMGQKRTIFTAPVGVCLTLNSGRDQRALSMSAKCQ